MTQIGLMIEGQNGLNWENWKNVLRTAEDSGYQCVFRSDHFTNPNGDHMDALELWTSLTYAASHTQRIEFGPLVTPITFRHPSFIVQYAAAVDVLSEGRLILGMGTGWQDREHREFGIYFPDLAERYERLEDGLEIVTRLFNSDDPVTYEGKHYSLDGAKITMKRPGGPKMLIGGNGPKKTLPLAAKYAVEWNAVYLDHETFKDRNTLLNQYLQEEGRTAADVKRSLMTRMIYRKDQAALDAALAGMSQSKEELQNRGLIVGTSQEVTDLLGKWADAGAERLMLQWMELDDMASLEDFAADVLPHFHR
ncbi:MAG: TIGR03560 family F420-dependent LLM class oxidoreductase [Anaerolineae bacterium]|nr:TIGR03560 family F420-dependent LLM class oxidoreductase [Anaerolineae bacterium]